MIEPEHVEAEKEAILTDWENYYTPEELEVGLEGLIRDLCQYICGTNNPNYED